MWGCRPSHGVKLDTQMINEVAGRFLNRLNRETLELTIPQAFEDFEGSDANFEIVTSQTLQKLVISYEHNVITHPVVFVFATTKWWAE